MRRAAEIGLEAAALALTALAAGTFGLYVERREVGRTLAEQYLRERGIDAAVSLEAIDAGGFAGRISLGPPGDPDFSAERVEVALSLIPPREGGPFRVEARAIRLVRPRLKLTWDGRRLSYGALDPLVEQMLKQPGQGPGPAVAIEDGRVRLSTPQGLLRLRGDAAADKGRLTRIEATLKPAQLRGQGFFADLAGGTIDAHGEGGALKGEAALDVDQLTRGDIDLEHAHTRVELTAPYPDARLAMRGRVLLRAALRAEAASAGDFQAGGAELNFTLDGLLATGARQASLSGTLLAAARSETFSASGAQGRRGQVNVQVDDLRLTRDPGGLKFAGRGSGSAQAATLASGKSLLRQASARLRSARFDGAAAKGVVAGEANVAGEAAVERFTQQALTLDGLTASVAAPAWRFAVGGDAPRGGGGFTARLGARTLTAALDAGPARLGGLEVVLAGQAGLRPDGPVLAARGSAFAKGALSQAEARRLARMIPGLGEQAPLTAALSDFRLSAPSLTLSAGAGSAGLALGAPVELAAASGGVIRLSPRGAVWRTDGTTASGGFELAMSGGGLPKARLDALAYRIDAGGAVEAQVALTAALDLPPATGASLDAQGRVRVNGGEFAFYAARCADLAADRLALGDNALERAKVSICSKADAPLVSASGSGWRLQGRFEDARGAMPAVQVRSEAGAGTFDMSGDARGVRTGALRVSAARLADTASPARFQPMAAEGKLGVAGGRWSGRLAVMDRKGDALGEITLRHDPATGAGSAEIDAGHIVFAQGGLQPGDLTPMANFTAPASGAVSFTGGFAWSRTGSTSSGELRARSLDFHSPAGGVNGLSADVRFSSLSPLAAAPGQTLSIETIGAAIPLTGIRLVFGLGAEALRLQSGAMSVAGGRVRLEPTVVSLQPGHASSGVLVLEGVEFGQLVAATSLADKVKLDAAMDGRLPFETGPEGLRFRQGRLAARKPGRISISRTALSGVKTGEGAPATQNAIQDFAYQAMENLAFDQLDATVNSLVGGRLGVLFHIVGRHDPAVGREAVVSLPALISGRAFDKPIPLPKGTPIDLTLDTSLNFDELVAAYRNIYLRHQAAGSGAVQAPAADMGADEQGKGGR